MNNLESPMWREFFQLDPVFPNRLLKASIERTIDFISTVVEDYSKRRLTYSADRAVAILGLQNRIASALRCDGRYGIFEKYLHRNLLWLRHCTAKMERIKYDKKAPSWSWMAYKGAIKFIKVRFGPPWTVDWHNGLKFDAKRKGVLIGSLGKFWKCKMTPDLTRFAILDFTGTKQGWIRFDVEDITDIKVLRCVVIGRVLYYSDMKYFILVVQLTGASGEYERVGVGLINESHVSKVKDNVRII